MFWLGLLLIFPLIARGQPTTGTGLSPRPNVVFILVDDLRWDELASTGHPFARTPNIDRLAVEGARFRNAFVTTPLCSRSRASFLTGQDAHTHGIADNTNRSAASHRLVTFRSLYSRGAAHGVVCRSGHAAPAGRHAPARRQARALAMG